MRKNSFLTLITIVAVIAIIAFACKKSSNTTTPPTTTKYFATVKNIINTNCANTCHASGGTAPDLSTDANIATNHTRIKARVIDGIKLDNTTNSFMPPGATRSIHGADSIAIVKWAAAGGKTTD